MQLRSVPPAVMLRLQIRLDHLTRIGERCREGLRQLAAGQLTRQDYVRLVEQQVDAQQAWEREQRKFFSSRRLRD